MPAPPRFLQELRGGVRLAVDGVKGVTNIVEAVHGSVARVAPVLGAAKEQPLGGITGLVYRSISGTTGLVGIGLDRALDAVEFVLQAVPRREGRGRQRRDPRSPARRHRQRAQRRPG